ncbi:MAG: glycosyltransferase, partial [Polyangiaceae bacterium]
MKRRFLFVVPPLTGHVNPTVAVGSLLRDRGHEVAWVGHPRRVRPLLPPDAKLIELDDGVSDEVWRPVLDRAKSVRGLASFELLWEDVLVPLARGMRPGVERAIESFGPDVVAVDHQALGGALACRKKNARWATLCTTSASVVDPFPDLPKVNEWVAEKIASLVREAELENVSHADLSPDLVIVFSTRALVGDLAFPDRFAFVGPALGRPENTAFPWDSLREGGKRILVSLGTVSSEVAAAFFGTVMRAFEGSDLQVVLVAPADLARNAPANFIVRDRVPQLALLPKMHAVVCHAGHNTVCESLAHGLPLVVAPIRDDQPVIANQVVSAGAGLRVKYGRLSPSLLRDSVMRVMNEPAFREAAQRIAKSFEEAGGARTAADRL